MGEVPKMSEYRDEQLYGWIIRMSNQYESNGDGTVRIVQHYSNYDELTYFTRAPEEAYPGWFPSSSMQEVQQYFKQYFRWYNNEHFHSGIDYIHPIDKHEGRAEEILKYRKECLIKQRVQRKLYWSSKNQIIGSGL